MLRYLIDIILAISFDKLRIHNKIRLVKIFDLMQDYQDIRQQKNLQYV